MTDNNNIDKLVTQLLDLQTLIQQINNNKVTFFLSQRLVFTTDTNDALAKL